MSDKIKLVLSELHAVVLKKACEAYCRAKLGQFKYALDEIFPHLDYERGRAIEEFIRGQFREQAIEKGYVPHYYFPDGYDWGIGNQKVGDGTLAYEVEKVIGNYLSVRRNDGYWGSGTNFSEPLCYRGGELVINMGGPINDTPLPEIEGFTKYKDFPLSAAKSRKMHVYCVNEQWDKAWDLISKLRDKGYLNYEGGEQKIMWRDSKETIDGKSYPDHESYFVRVFKPRRKEEIGS